DVIKWHAALLYVICNSLNNELTNSDNTATLGKRKALRNELFEENIPHEHKNSKTHREISCLIC
ncbi:13123_t:CDS:1, partial [Funneliformis geosporum]